MKRVSVLSVLCGMLLVVFGAPALAQDRPITVKPENVKWTDIKEMQGWKEAILVGDPAKPGPYVQRIKIPPNSLVPPHSHPDTENITVLAGSFGIGEGATVDKTKGQVLGAGSFYLLPANTVHFAWAGPKGATLQIHGVGPSGMTMAGPAQK
jgi:quercetin dioxygenase-like cupin family protein